MSIKTRMLTLVGLGLERRDQDVGAAVIDALLNQAMGVGSADASTTAAVATAVQAISAPLFATCRVSGAPVPLRAAFLVALVRRLMLSGNFVAAIDVDSFGAITLRPAASFKVGGSSRRPIYELEFANPAGSPPMAWSTS